MRRSSNEGGYVSKTGSPRETGQARERRVQTITGASVPAEGGPSLNVAQLHQETLFPVDDLPQVAAAPNSGFSALAVPAHGSPQLLTPSVWVMPPGWTTTPPQWRTMTAARTSLWIDDALAQARPAQRRVESSEKSLSEDDSIEFDASQPTEDDLMQAWNERQTLIANWKNETWTGALPGDVMGRILRKALEVDDRDDVRPELAFLRNLGLVCKALAVTVEALRTDQGESSVLRGGAAAHEKVILGFFYDFEMAFKEDFLRKRWGFPAALENRYDMARFGKFLKVMLDTGVVHWISNDDDESGAAAERFQSFDFKITDFDKFEFTGCTSESSRKTWTEFVKKYGDEMTDLCIHIDKALVEQLDATFDKALVEQLGHFRKLSRLEFKHVHDHIDYMDRAGHYRKMSRLDVEYGRDGIDFNWLGDLAELKTLHFIDFSEEVLVPASVLARLRNLVVDIQTLDCWRESGMRPSDWTAMEDLTITKGYPNHPDWFPLELPPNLLRFKAATQPPDELVFPLGLTALDLSSFRENRIVISKITKLNALTELIFLPDSGDKHGLDLTGTRALADFLKSDRHRLRVLHLTLHENLEVMNEFLAALTSFDSLETLELILVPMHAEVYAALAKVIARQTHLRRLSVNFSSQDRHGDEAFAPLKKAIAESASLRQVNVFFWHPQDKRNRYGRDIMRGMNDLLLENRNLLEMSAQSYLNSYWSDVEYADLKRNWLLRPESKPPGTGNS